MRHAEERVVSPESGGEDHGANRDLTTETTATPRQRRHEIQAA